MSNPDEQKTHKYSDNCPRGTRFRFDSFYGLGTQELVRALTCDPPELDISDPANPQQIAAFDSSNASGFGFDGTWGVYPHAASGLIYLADQDNGLYVVRIDAPDLSLAGPASVIPGGSHAFDVSSASPSATCYLLVSGSNAGLALGGTTFEIGAGWSLFATGTTDGNGDLSFPFTVPAGTSGRTAYFEAATNVGSVLNSNLIRVQVQ